MTSNFLIFFSFDIFYFLSSDILELDVKYPKELHNFHCDLLLLLKKELEKKSIKCNKLVYNLYDKKRYVVHIFKTSIRSWNNIKESA